MASPKQQSKGFEWVPTTFSLEPRWTTEIDPESIKRVIEATTTARCLQVKFLAQGAFNKIYTVCIDGGTLIMRVSLPVDPEWKTASEVATMEWIHDNTALPLPRVLAYQSNQDNALGFEWILMTKMPGKTLSKAWRSIDMEAKQKIVHHFALYASVLFKNQLRGIGNIFLDPREKSHGKTKFTEVGGLSRCSF
ncbi:phosphotransferase enzyme family protein [Hirsutella rhossiliensis]